MKKDVSETSGKQDINIYDYTNNLKECARIILDVSKRFEMIGLYPVANDLEKAGKEVYDLAEAINSHNRTETYKRFDDYQKNSKEMYEGIFELIKRKD